MKGKELCEFLKNVRRKLAEANGISYEPRECSHEGDCPGTCPLCDAELQSLLSEIEKMEAEGKPVNLDVLTDEEKAFLAHGTIEPKDEEEEGKDGLIEVREMGLVAEPLMGDVAAPDEGDEDDEQTLMGEPRLENPPQILAGIPAMPMESFFDIAQRKYVGGKIDDAVWGAIIGDIAGSRFEFNPTDDYDFEMFTDECDYTDDTICTIAVADALLRGKDFGESIHDWCRRFPHPMGGYGGSFRKWVLSNNPQPYNSFGNGAAMRVSPVACWYGGDNLNKVIQSAEATAAPTHNHPEGVKGAQTVALAIAIALKNSRLRKKDEAADVKSLLNACVEFSDYNINLKDENVRNRFDETCQGTVPVALWIIGKSHSFGDAVRRAVSLGADADTLGAIVGSIAGAIWGIPHRFIERARLYLPMEMRDVLKEFCEECRKRDLERVLDN